MANYNDMSDEELAKTLKNLGPWPDEKPEKGKEAVERWVGQFFVAPGAKNSVSISWLYRHFRANGYTLSWTDRAPGDGLANFTKLMAELGFRPGREIKMTVHAAAYFRDWAKREKRKDETRTTTF
jgi:hypothetical protein